MKKVLFATTALVASAGIASAQGVEVSGSAEMGIVGGSRYADEVQFLTSVDVRFTMSGETDNGLTFGATIDLDDLADMSAGIFGYDPVDNVSGQFADYTVFLSGNFGTITMGDTDGAFDWALQDLDVIADINDSNTAHPGFNGNGGLDGVYDGQVARYDYSFGDFAFAVSAEIDDFGVGGPAFGIGGRYSGDLGGVTLGVGIGYQQVTDAVLVDTIGPLFGDYSVVGISFDAQFNNGIRAIVNYSQLDTPAGWVDPDEHMGVGLFYTMDALSVGVNYGIFSGGTPGLVADSEGFGLAVNYDLGGGAVVQFGYGTGDTDDGTLTATQTSVDTFSLGVAMSF